MINKLKFFAFRQLLTIKIYFISFFSIKINDTPIQITEFQPAGNLRLAENKKLKILKSTIEEKPDQVTHELALRFLTLSARKNAKFQNEKELKKDLEQIIKLCIDWHTKYKEEEKL